MSKLHQARSLLNHLLKAQTKYYLHSPFLYELAEEVIYDTRQYYAFRKIENLRSALKQSKMKVEVNDLGAGSQQMKGKERKVADIARYASVSPQKGQLLFKLVKYFQANQILELGTALGLGTAYMASGNTNAEVTSIEGCKNLAQIAYRNWDALQLNKINVVKGDFKDVLPKVLNDKGKFDLIYLDGNHQYQPTLDYFNQCLPYVTENGLIVLDDIHWSGEMEAAWEVIVANETVTLSIDLYDIGLVFFRQSSAKEHFRLKWWKEIWG